MKKLIFLGVILTLAGCGQRAPAPYGNSGPLIIRGASTASGPISRACMASTRKGKSSQLCGCIQSAANQTLTPGQQNRATQFYMDPHKAQEVRQSDRRGDEEFWKAYRAYGERAEQMCS